MPWYRAGQVAITAGQNTVTGTGTAFSANARVGDAFQGPDGRWYEVTNIASATVLSILPAYQGVTVAGGSYALAPMQGYVKESADRLRQIVNDWGSTLAGLGSVSTENVVPVAKGGTGGTTPALARSGLGLKTAAVADIVGAVSQSGGVPTGAIVERGSNANGEYVKFADGTLISWGFNAGASPTTPSTGLYGTTSGVTYAGNLAVALPASFIDTNYRVIPIGTTRGHVRLAYNNNASTFTVSFANAASEPLVPFSWIAIGRWF